jgi:DNA-directed RNA polymerase subunit M/transcription elongation factor TFIIS
MSHLKDLQLREVKILKSFFSKSKRLKDYSNKDHLLLCSIIEQSICDATIDKAMEFSIPNYWENQEFQTLYTSIGYKIKMNLDPNSSVNKNLESNIKNYLINRVCDYLNYRSILKHQKSHLAKGVNKCKCFFSTVGEIAFKQIMNFIKFPITKIGYMSSIELNPIISKNIYQELELRASQNIQIKYSEMYPCKNCGKRKARVREIQTRSSDEGGTIFVTCLSCGNVWRIYG